MSPDLSLSNATARDDFWAMNSNTFQKSPMSSGMCPLSYSLVVMLFFSSTVQTSKSRYEETKVDSEVSEMVSSLGQILEMNSLKSFVIKRDQVINPANDMRD